MPIFCRKRVLAWLLAAAFAIPGQAQSNQSGGYQIDIQPIDGRYGLESMIIRTIYQDRKGFIWVSTPGGLARFNGYEFVYFKDPRFIGKSNAGVDIIGDIEDLILLAGMVANAEGGDEKEDWQVLLSIYLLEPESGRILPFSASIGKNIPFDEQRIRLLKLHNGTLYAGLNDGRIYGYSKGKWTLFYAQRSKDIIRALLIDTPDKPFWVMAGDTLSLVSPEGKPIEREHLSLRGRYWKILEDGHGQKRTRLDQPS